MNKIIVNQYNINSPILSKNQKIAFMSDIHGESDKLERLIEYINELEIKTLLLGGDLIDSTENIQQNEKVKELLKELSKTTKIFMSIGNHDIIYFNKNSNNRCHEMIEKEIPFWQELSEIDNIFIPKLPIEEPTFSNWSLDEDIDISTINMPISYYWNKEPLEEFEQVLKTIHNMRINTEKTNILLCHSPKNIGNSKLIEEYTNELKKFNIILSGHMHSGLVPLLLRSKTYGRGFAGPYNTLLPEYAYGIKEEKNVVNVTTGGVIKIASTSGPSIITNNKIVQNTINFIYPEEIEILQFLNDEKYKVEKVETKILKRI